MLVDVLREAAGLDELAQHAFLESLAQDPALTVDEVMKAAYTLVHSQER